MLCGTGGIELFSPTHVLSKVSKFSRVASPFLVSKQCLLNNIQCTCLTKQIMLKANSILF
jgi:hypothetical protein